MPARGTVGAVLSIGLAANTGILFAGAVFGPIAFAALPDDHAAAGRLAGSVFLLAYQLSTVIFGVTLWLLWKDAQRGLAGAGLLLAATLTFAVAPMINRHGAGWPFSFANLHAAAGVLHLLLMAVALGLAWRLRRLD